MEASTSKEYGDFAKLLEDEIMNYNYEEKEVDACFVEGTEKIHANSDKEVNEKECSDTTECSSSFDESDCGAEGFDTLDDSEVLSDFRGGAGSALNFDGSGKLSTMRKKLSPHWRSFIHPLMWRCKWLELQINMLEGQARKYDRKLQGCSQKNMFQFEKSTLEGHGINTFSQNSAEVLRRKKRRRAEATNDIPAYMSHHNLFSYYEHRRYIGEISHNVLKNLGAPQGVNIDVEMGNDELLCAEAGNCDNFLEDILRKIELLHSRVLNLRTRADKVMSEHAPIKLSSTDTLSSPASLKASLSSPPSTMHRMPVGTYIASQLMSEYNLGAVLLLESGVSDANGSRDHAHLPYAYENEDDDEVLIDNHRVREELCYFEEVKIHSMQRPWVLKDLDQNYYIPAVPQPPKITDDQPRPQTCSTSNLINTPTSDSKRRKN